MFPVKRVGVGIALIGLSYFVGLSAPTHWWGVPSVWICAGSFLAGTLLLGTAIENWMGRT